MLDSQSKESISSLLTVLHKQNALFGREHCGVSVILGV